MIVRVCNTDLLKLVNGESVVIGEHIVRPTDEAASMIEGLEDHAGAEVKLEYAGVVRGRRTNARNALTGKGNRTAKVSTGHFFMRAMFDGICYADGCDKALRKGRWMVRDADNKQNLCTGHGVERFPDLKDRPDYQEAMTV